ncbi:LacI family DNA-binding transcriptional regulator [Jiangella anatolica]|nr:LacI family DNA-binding transcriptional regulator [Jiangella anatolica]
MADVARLAQVSPQTVSRVLNDYAFIRPDTRDRVLQAIDVLDYRPNQAARTLATSRSRTIGVVATDYLSYGPAAALWGVERAAGEAGYGVSIVSLRESNHRAFTEAMQRLVGQSVEGIVMIAPQDQSTHEVFDAFDNVPVVTLSSFETGEHKPIMLDSAEGSRIATRHLVELGHTVIAHLSGPPRFTVSEERVRGWREVLAETGLAAPEPVVGDWTAESGYLVGRELAADRHVTAVYAANDRMAQGLLLALHEAGRRVPQDVSVVGFDDVPEAAYMIPPLTTVRQDFAALGRRCIEAVLALIGNEPRLEPDPLVPTLVVRESSGPAPR